VVKAIGGFGLVKCTIEVGEQQVKAYKWRNKKTEAGHFLSRAELKTAAIAGTASGCPGISGKFTNGEFKDEVQVEGIILQ